MLVWLPKENDTCKYMNAGGFFVVNIRGFEEGDSGTVSILRIHRIVRFFSALERSRHLRIGKSTLFSSSVLRENFPASKHCKIINIQLISETCFLDEETWWHCKQKIGFGEEFATSTLLLELEKVVEMVWHSPPCPTTFQSCAHLILRSKLLGSIKFLALSRVQAKTTFFAIPGK